MTSELVYVLDLGFLRATWGGVLILVVSACVLIYALKLIRGLFIWDDLALSAREADYDELEKRLHEKNEAWDAIAERHRLEIESGVVHEVPFYETKEWKDMGRETHLAGKELLDAQKKLKRAVVKAFFLDPLGWFAWKYPAKK